ncbi:MAG: ribosomal protein S18-alanine N-acetyltransferase [Elusimicrobia bacterium]|jgi:ribosomal-protein-alanine N-acetyltransferase|nr:ribosomal protein S18-alanine N-acetyltransferase [Elusimicrobiota bacterium]
MTENKFLWRLAEPRDVSNLLDIERGAFATPWTREEIEEELDKPMARVWVAEHEDRLVAFGIQWFVVGESQLANIAVHSDFRRLGLGKQMMRHLLADAQTAGMEKMTLEVRTGNTAAIELYRQLGFIETSRRPKFYEDKDEAILMEISLGKTGKE